MSEKEVPLFTVEGIVDRLDRINRRLVWIVVLLIVLLVGSNVAWLIYESQFETYTETSENEVTALQVGDENWASGGDLIVNAGSEDEK